MKKLFSVLLMLFCHLAWAQKTGSTTISGGPAGLLMPAVVNVSTNWQNAGLITLGGIPTRSQCGATVPSTGLVPPQANDDSDKINAAVSSCPTGQKVVLGASTTVAANVTISGNTMTVNSGGAGAAVTWGVRGTNIQPGATIISGTAPTFTLNMPPSVGATVTSQTVTLYSKFNISSTKPILVNKSITVSGFDNCNPSICGTEISMYDGALPDWSIGAAPGATNAHCGTTTTSASICGIGNPIFLLSPSSINDWGWSGCNFGVNPTSSNCGTLIAADIAQGATQVQIASTTGFQVGGWALLDESPQVVSTANPTGGSNVNASAEWLTNPFTTAVMRLEGGDLPAFYSFSPNRTNEELHKITAIGAGPCPGTNCTLTFDDPVTLAFRQSGSHDGRVYYPTRQSVTTANPFLSQAGVENMTITRPANSGVTMTFCQYCWVRNTAIGGWLNGGINATYSARSQIEFNYLYQGFDLENNGTEYPIGISTASTECYILNNIIVFGGKGMVGRASNSCVVAYNYVDRTMYMQSSIGDYWVDMSLNGSHYAGTHHWLFEGNWSNHCDSDETHGNAIYHTFFGNNCSGLRSTSVDVSNINLSFNDTAGTAFTTNGAPAAPAFRRAAGPMAFDYGFAYVNNVLGTAGVTTTANSWQYRCTALGSKCIWGSGWTGSEWPGPDTNLNGATSIYIFKNANYDAVNNGIVDNASGFSQSFPNSLYLAGGGATAPYFFTAGVTCTYPWPWVTPASSPQIKANSCSGSGNPAKARYDAGTPFAQP